MSPLALLRWSVDLLQLRGTPADAPPSQWFLLQVIALDLIISLLYLQAVNVELSWGSLMGRTLLRIAMIYALLWVFGRTERFLQTTVAIFAASALLSALAMPIASAVMRSQMQTPDLGLEFLQLGFLCLFLWPIAVDAHIYRHALGLKLWYTLPLSLVLFMVFFDLSNGLFPIE